MFVGKVIGTVWSTVKWPELGGHKLLIVRPYHLDTLRAKHGQEAGQTSGQAAQSAQALKPEIPETVVCIDLLDAGVGDDVVVAFGHAARVAAESSGASPATDSSHTPPKTPIDAAVVAVVDGYSLPDVGAELADPVALDGTTR